MVDEKLPHNGSWKGQVIKAIAVDGAKQWKEIQECTELSPLNLNSALDELANLDILTKQVEGSKTTYRVSYEIYKKYDSHYNESKAEYVSAKPKSSQTLLQSVERWNERYENHFDASLKHFYLEGAKLSSFLLHCIDKAKQSILIVTPFIEKVSLSDAIVQSVQNKVTATVVTAIPKGKSRERKFDYFDSLQNKGVAVYLKLNVHAKIMVFDAKVGVVSSLNFTSNPVSSKSWEVGLVSLSQETVRSIMNSIHRVIEDSESWLDFKN